MNVPPDDPIRIMIVDDQRDVRFLIAAILEGSADLAVVAEAANGDEALARIEDTDPDVVILDAMMPGKDGLATAGEILDRRPDQPIILCSATVDPRVWERARASGVAVCLSKDEFFSIPEVARGLAART